MTPSKGQNDLAAQGLLSALADLEDYGTARSTKTGAVTMPAQARSELRLPADAHWQVLGSPALGIAIVIGRPARPSDTLRILLDAE
jgi:hypothetical protein